MGWGVKNVEQCWRWGLKTVVNEDLADKVTFKQWPEEGEGDKY